MKVLMFNKLYHPHIGGVERTVYDLCEELKQEVRFKVLASNTKPRTELERRGSYHVIRAASLGRFMSSVHLGVGIPSCWKRLDYDIVHFHFPSPVGEMLCLKLCPKDKPIIVTYHSDIVGYEGALALYRPLLLKFFRRVDKIIVTSPVMAEKSPLLREFRHKCEVIPLGIQTEKFRLTPEVEARSISIRRRYGTPIVLFVGRLVGYKGLDYLIRAMKDIDGTLLIVGKGPEERRLKGHIGEAGVDKNKIFFVGPVSDEDLPAYYYSCDVFVLPSIGANEAFGVTQLEAQACGRPVVSTSLPTGVPFVNQDGQTGLVVPPRSSERLAGAINALLKNDDMRRRLGARAKERVEAEFTCKIMARRTLDSYRKVLMVQASRQVPAGS